MPNQDGTGPNGQGPRSGRGMGNCEGQGGGRQRRGFGRGGGTGRGSGLGLGGNAQNNSWPQTQLSDLKAAIERLTEKIK